MKKEIVERLEGFLTQKGSVILELNRQEAIDVLQSHQKLKDALKDCLDDSIQRCKDIGLDPNGYSTVINARKALTNEG